MKFTPENIININKKLSAAAEHADIATHPKFMALMNALDELNANSESPESAEVFIQAARDLKNHVQHKQTRAEKPEKNPYYTVLMNTLQSVTEQSEQKKTERSESTASAVLSKHGSFVDPGSDNINNTSFVKGLKEMDDHAPVTPPTF